MHEIGPNSFRTVAANLLLGGLSMTLLAPSLKAFQEMAEGELFLTLDPEIRYDSNVFANSSEIDDALAVIPVGLLYIRDRGKVRTEARGGVEVGRFAELSSQNYEDLFAEVRFREEKGQGPLAFHSLLGFWRESRADALLGERTRVDRGRIGGELSYTLDQRVKLTGGTSYERWSYAGSLTDYDQWEMTVGAAYVFSERLETGAAYAHRTVWLDDAPLVDSLQDDAVYLTLRGRILPRVESTAELGVRHRHFNGGDFDDESSPYFSLGLDWAIDEDTHVVVSGRSDFRFSPRDASVEENRVDLQVWRRLDPKIRAEVFGYALWQDVESFGGAKRTDDETGGGARLHYRFTELVSAVGEARYLVRSSENSYYDYERFIASLSLLWQY